ncbi:hypothetical protein AC629_13410 [Bradyrhizobium sp. NAS80.1]|uniref:hypothetical protein n=1 Tax=Bradyrhizobium sp. NAS80.1 TaxID=1680159 RepID=UPI00096872B8|nr:hypothetical protein [Bradyrhizobium sp. NAS80.1]OKO87654.1 hypothetical protein AC629_13410 [Bradyrhizobium sp. NAS80.1]
MARIDDEAVASELRKAELLIKALQNKAACFQIDKDTQNEALPWTVDVFFNDFKGEPDLLFSVSTVATEIGEFFQDKWPWLDFSYTDQHEILPGRVGVLRSRLHVWINDLGKAYIEVEKCYESGAAEFLVDDPRRSMLRSMSSAQSSPSLRRRKVSDT